MTRPRSRQALASALLALIGLGIAAPAEADHVDLASFLAISEGEGVEIRRLAAEVFGRLGCAPEQCPAAPNTIRLCARATVTDPVPLTARWDRAFLGIASDWGGAALPWRRIGPEAAVPGHRKSFARDGGTTVLLLRVFIPAGQEPVLEVQASKHPWL